MKTANQLNREGASPKDSKNADQPSLRRSLLNTLHSRVTIIGASVAAIAVLSVAGVAQAVKDIGNHWGNDVDPYQEILHQTPPAEFLPSFKKFTIGEEGNLGATTAVSMASKIVKVSSGSISFKTGEGEFYTFDTTCLNKEQLERASVGAKAFVTAAYGANENRLNTGTEDEPFTGGATNLFIY